MTVRELYAFLNEKIPPALSCSWDNDGLMCAWSMEKEVKRVLVALDITRAVAEKAIAEGYDVILSHHPMIFHPLKNLNPDDPIAQKAMALIRADVAAMSFHTRLDAVEGGVNDVLCAKLGLENVQPFGEGDEAIGRIGDMNGKMTLEAFAALVKEVTGADAVQYADAGKKVSRVAVLGGGGSSDVDAAFRAGADTYVSGELKHSCLTEAPERGMNLVAAGHFHTEDPVCRRLCELAQEADPKIIVEIVNSNPVRVI